ncbi:MAG: pentapeptide repeat-containing protein [Alphaproteobacteria bacterium]|nr:pentapeptide repeat-containing protein [Alphaproteobacteria bacterium]
MTEPHPELPPSEGELYSDRWWQRVAPQLTPEGKALVHKTLMEAADRLESSDKQAFETALRALKTPSPQQLAFLQSPRDPTAQKNLLQDDCWDLSNILVCHPQTGEKIQWKFLPEIEFYKSIFVGHTDFSGKQFKNCMFENTWFIGNANFSNATFINFAKFYSARFINRADFMFAKFNGEANFYGVSFQKNVDFQSAEFSDQYEANFESANFAIDVNFYNVKFNSKAIFVETIFAGNARFDSAVFSGLADFRWAKFMETANFTKNIWHRTKFIMEAWFFRAEFHNKTIFLNAEFAGAANFLTAEFTDMVVFAETTFTGVANFHAARFGKTVSFRGSKWEAVPDFVGTAFKDGMAIADLKNLQSGLTACTIAWDADAEPEPATSIFRPAPITDRLQALRKMAHDADDRPRELDYFALELQSRYQAKKKLVTEGDDISQETEDGDTNRHSEQERGWLWLKRLLVWLYGRFSDYGRGIGRPLLWLAGLWVLSALGYTLLITNAPPIAMWLCLTVWALFIGAVQVQIHVRRDGGGG